MTGTAGRVIVVTGAAGSAGTATTRALAAAGATVVAVGRSPERLSAMAQVIPGISVEVADLTDSNDVHDLAARVRAKHGAVDGLVHLVGGYRGGATFAANTDADWQFLSAGLVDSLRHATLAFHDDLAASTAGRAVIVSARAAQAPTAGSANYAAAKAAAEAWMLALADSLRPLPGSAGRRTTDLRGDHPGDQGPGGRADAGGPAGAAGSPVSPTSTTWPPGSSGYGRWTPRNSTAPGSTWAADRPGRPARLSPWPLVRKESTT